MLQRQNRLSDSAKDMYVDPEMRETPICRICSVQEELMEEVEEIPCRCPYKYRYIHKTCLQEWINTYHYNEHWKARSSQGIRQSMGSVCNLSKSESEQIQINEIETSPHEIKCRQCKQIVRVKGKMHKKCRKQEQISRKSVMKFTAYLILFVLLLFLGISGCITMLQTNKNVGIILFSIFGLGVFVFLLAGLYIVSFTFWRNLLKDIEIIVPKRKMKGQEKERIQGKSEKESEGIQIDIKTETSLKESEHQGRRMDEYQSKVKDGLTNDYDYVE